MARNESRNRTAQLGLRTLVRYCTERDTLLRSIKTALVIGTILAALNHGQDLLAGQFSPHWVIPMGLTYLVPFVVATYGQVQANDSETEHGQERKNSLLMGLQQGAKGVCQRESCP